nr:hypothetical protein [Nitrosomonas nitrosa]
MAILQSECESPSPVANGKGGRSSATLGAAPFGVGSLTRLGRPTGSDEGCGATGDSGPQRMTGVPDCPPLTTSPSKGSFLITRTLSSGISSPTERSIPTLQATAFATRWGRGFEARWNTKPG